MFNFIYNFIFIVCSIIILINALSYALYEYKKENNKSGGIVVATFSLLIVVFSNIIIWTR